jgi:hypothetical protein
MNLNSTLVIQGINFFCAYFILRRYLFGPVVAMVHQEQAQQKALEQAIQMRKHKVDQQEQQLKDSWLAFQELYAQKIPPVQDRQIFRQIKPSLEYKNPTAEAVKMLTAEFVPLAVQKVKDVHW